MEFVVTIVIASAFAGVIGAAMGARYGHKEARDFVIKHYTSSSEENPSRANLRYAIEEICQAIGLEISWFSYSTPLVHMPYEIERRNKLLFSTPESLAMLMQYLGLGFKEIKATEAGREVIKVAKK